MIVSSALQHLSKILPAVRATSSLEAAGQRKLRYIVVYSPISTLLTLRARRCSNLRIADVAEILEPGRESNLTLDALFAFFGKLFDTSGSVLGLAALSAEREP